MFRFDDFRTNQSNLLFQRGWKHLFFFITFSAIISDVLAKKRSDITIGKINIDSELQTGTKYGVRGIPFLLLFHNGEVIDQKVGAANKSSIKEWLETKVK